jgi:DNA-binding transcriptional LysR family regulator
MLRITFRQIEAFYWTAKLGTVNAAAKHLFLSQPAVTARLKELEDVLALTLFSRSHQKVDITPAGRQVLAQAEALLHAGSKLEALGAVEVPPLHGVLRFGADDSSAAAGVSEMLSRLKQRYPKLRVELNVETSKVLHEKLSRRELDLVLHTSPVKKAHVVDQLIGRVQLAWVSSTGRAMGEVPLTPLAAAPLPIITNPPSSILHQVARQWLQRGGEDFHHLNTCNSLSMIMRLVQDGHALAALPIPVVRENIELGRLKIVDSDPPLAAIEYYISYLTEKESSGIGALVEMARETLKDVNFFIDLAESKD